jgi:hypothetical protein
MFAYLGGVEISKSAIANGSILRRFRRDSVDFGAPIQSEISRYVQNNARN